LKRGYYVIISGIGLFAAGIIVFFSWAVPTLQQIASDSATLENATIQPRQSERLFLDVVDPNKSLSVLINSVNQDVPMHATLSTPEDVSAINTDFTGNAGLSAEPTIPGRYNLTITNNGNAPTTVNIVFGYIPGIQNNQFDIKAYNAPIIGSAVAGSGILVIIAGVVLLLLDRRKATSSKAGKSV
jgi:hypothetical protein